MIRIFILYFLIGSAMANTIIIPVLYMPLFNVEPFSAAWKNLAHQDLIKKFAAIHLVEKEPANYNIDKLYGTQMRIIGNHLQITYINAQSPPPASSLTDLNYYWAVTIPESDIKGTTLEGVNAQYNTFGQVQEMMLITITKKMSIDLSKVALRLGVPERNLSYSYDPAKWEDVVHAMVKEGIKNYLIYLEIVSVDKLASLFTLSTTQLKNSTIHQFIVLLPPILTKKELMDKNKTRDILASLGVTANSSEATLFHLIQQTTNLSVQQFGILYNLTREQQRVLERSTLLQFSQACGIPMSQILDKNIPSIVWDTVGDLTRSVSCFSMLKVKGVPISALTGLTNPRGKTVLQILLSACNQYWKTCRYTMTLQPTEWECIDCLTLDEAVTKLSTTAAALLSNPVHDLVAAIAKKCKDGQINLTTCRQKNINSLESLFNLTFNEVKTMLEIQSSESQSFTIAQYVCYFLNASSKDLGIDVNTMYNTTNKTHQEVCNSPIYELYEIIPFILTSGVKIPASQLRMSDSDTFSLLELLPDNSTIAQFKYAVKYVLPAIVESKNKFENVTVGSYLTSNSITDNDAGEKTTLTLLLELSGFKVEMVKTIYKMTSAQVSVLTLLRIKELQKYCGLDLSLLKTKTSFNITAMVVGILSFNPTCKATNFYVKAKSIPISNLKSVCSTVASDSTSFMRMIEQCSGLTWRYNARIFGVGACDWPQMDVLNKGILPSLSDLSSDTQQQKTLEQLLAKVNKVHRKNLDTYKNYVSAYFGPMRTHLFSIFSTSKSEMIQILKITDGEYDGYGALEIVEKVQVFLKTKYTITLSTVASTLGIPLNATKCLAPTEWNETISPLKSEIVASGSMQLNVIESNFKVILRLGDISVLSLSQLKSSWDSDFIRILGGKTFSENKTISDIQTILSISQQSFLQETLLVFYNKHLNLTKVELSILFSIDVGHLDILTEFTFQEIPCSCKFSGSNLVGKTPHSLMDSMVGDKDVISCRPIALLVADRFLSIDALILKFNVTVNDAEPLLTVIQKLSNLPLEKIAWGLDAELSDWPVLAAVSLQMYVNITNVTAVKNNSFKVVTAQVIATKERFTAQLHAFHASLLVQASNLIAVSSTDACGQCAIPSTNILKTFLGRLGNEIYLDPRKIPPVAGFECITHDLFLLQPQKWHLLIPGIIPNSFLNVSSILKISETKLALILGSSRSSIVNMTLTNYLQLVTKRVHPQVRCYKTINTEITYTKAVAKGAVDSPMKKQNVLQMISVICSDVNVYNMTAIMGWENHTLSVLENHTMEDAALCKKMSIKSIMSRTMLDLVKMITDEVDGCVVIPCRSGTSLDTESYNCADVNECNATSTCENDQICQNYFGGHECDCSKPGYFVKDKVCEGAKRFFLEVTFNIKFTQELSNSLTVEYYTFKEKVQQCVNDIFGKVSTIYYMGCKLDKFRKGSVVAEVSVYTSKKYVGSVKQLETYFRNGLTIKDGKTYWKDLEIKSNAIADYNECERNQVNCHQYATCINKLGTFSCKCDSGYDGDGVDCEAGFLKSYWWLIIILAVILLIIIIVIIVLVIKKPRLKSYGVDEDLPPLRRSGSDLSYKNGDVFYKDKDGNTREGTLHGEPEHHQNPLYGREIPENVYESSDTTHWTNNINALDNMGMDTPNEDEGIEMNPATMEEINETTVLEVNEKENPKEDLAMDHVL